jgi:hypothetical protein
LTSPHGTWASRLAISPIFTLRPGDLATAAEVATTSFSSTCPILPDAANCRRLARTSRCPAAALATATAAVTAGHQRGERGQRVLDRPLNSASLISRSASAFGSTIFTDGSAPAAAGGLGGSGVRMARALLRSTIAVAAAPPAASSAVPATIFGQRRPRRFGGSSLRAVVASIDETFGPMVSCTLTLPRAARIAIQARILPTLGLAQPAAPSAPRLAVPAALLVIGPAWSASFDACAASFLARHCMSEAGMLAALYLVTTDTDVLPRE